MTSTTTPRRTRRRSAPPRVETRRTLGLLGLGVFGVALTGLLSVVGLFWYYGRDLPNTRDLLRTWHPPQTTRILARDGTVLAELFIERRTVVPLETLPRDLVISLMAAEDADFYRHRGLDYPGLLRALIVNIRRGTIAQGASTITQQVVKNVVLSPERTLRRKVQEVLLARRIEQELTKNEILFLYVNHIAFGHGRNGVQEAARYYFGRDVGQLTLGECVLLAGIPKSPVRYSPRNDLDAALRRRHWILGQMVEKGFVTQAQADVADREPVRLSAPSQDAEGAAPEVDDVVRRTLAQLAGADAVRRGGYTVHTTLDPVLQRAARMAVERGLRDLDTRHGYRGPFVAPGQRRPRGSGNVARAERAPADHRLLPGHVYLGTVERAEDPDPARREQGGLVVRVGRATGRVPWSTAARYAQSLTPTQFAPAGATVRVSVDQLITPEAPGSMRLELGPQASLVAIDPGTREVLAMVGGYDALPGMFNRATRAQRQPGSAFKPFVYSYALASRRFTLASAIDPNPGCFGTGRTAWCPAEAHAHRDGLEPAMRLREALAQSRNMVAARVIEALGPEAVGTHARALGITSPLPTDLSLALGTGSVTPAELTNAYATWASGGHYQDWMIIRRVVDPNGRDVPLPARAPVREAVSPAEAWLVTSALSSVIDRGTARAARSLNRPAAGKTGTTNRNIDAWFVGYTPDLVTGVWVGFDDRAPLGNGEEGSRAALPVWTNFMRDYVRARRPPSLEFRRPEGVNVVRVDPATGLLPPGDGGVVPGFATPMEEYFLAGTEPHEAAPVDAGPPVDVLSADAPPSEAPGLVLPIENPVAPAAESDGGDPTPPDAAVAVDATSEPSAP